MDPKHLDALLAVGKKHGLKVLKVGDVVAEYGTSPLALSDLGEAETMPTEDELLFASSGMPMTEDEMRAKPPA